MKKNQSKKPVTLDEQKKKLIKQKIQEKDKKLFDKVNILK